MMEAVGESILRDHLILTDRHLSDLHTHGAVLIQDFFSADEIADACRDIQTLFSVIEPDPSVRLLPEGPDIREFPSDGWFDYVNFPYPSRALNMIGCHPAILAAARAAIGSDDVLMHYNYATAKFAGDQNYSQPLHLDSPMHSFFSPSRAPKFLVLNCVIYLSDVDAGSGPLSYLPRPASSSIPHGKITLDEAENEHYAAQEVAAIAPAGSVLLYFHDVYHRATNLLSPGASRYQIVASYHASEVSSFIGGIPWPREALTCEWDEFLPHASIEQLAALGIPPPGHEFWSAQILDELGQRFPAWDLAPYRFFLTEC